MQHSDGSAVHQRRAMLWRCHAMAPALSAWLTIVLLGRRTGHRHHMHDACHPMYPSPTLQSNYMNGKM
eukprot:352149-Chlamydomonas_euryale.AAC.8